MTVRIVSILPSATEIVCLLGLRAQLVGVTHECDYPEDVRGLPHVTRSFIPETAPSGEIDRLVREQLRTRQSLYALDYSLLESLRPDLIVTQALCDVCAVDEQEVREAARRLPGTPRVVNLEPMGLEDVFGCIEKVGRVAGVAETARVAVESLRNRVAAVGRRVATSTRLPRVVMLEWIDPMFSSGHWSPELVRLAGGREMIGIEGRRSRTITWSDLRAAQPECLVIACCGFRVERTLRDFASLRAHPDWHQLPCARSGEVYVVDGSAYFNRPGPRLVDSLEILAHIFHGDGSPVPEHLRGAVWELRGS